MQTLKDEINAGSEVIFDVWFGYLQYWPVLSEINVGDCVHFRKISRLNGRFVQLQTILNQFVESQTSHQKLNSGKQGPELQPIPYF